MIEFLKRLLISALARLFALRPPPRGSRLSFHDILRAKKAAQNENNDRQQTDQANLG